MGECTKTVLFVFNFFIFAVGVAVVVAAGLLLSQHREYGALLGNVVFTLPLVLLFIGVSIFLLGFLACCGAIMEKPCMLYAYASVVLLLVMAEITLVALLVVFKDEAEVAIQDLMRQVFREYGGHDFALTSSLDHAQNELQCCGVLSFADWQNTTYGNATNGVADGCCRTLVRDCGKGLLLGSPVVIFETINTNGCYIIIKEKFGHGSPLFFIVVAVIILVQLVSVSFAFGVARHSRRRKMSVAPGH